VTPPGVKRYILPGYRPRAWRSVVSPFVGNVSERPQNRAALETRETRPDVWTVLENWIAYK